MFLFTQGHSEKLFFCHSRSFYRESSFSKTKRLWMPDRDIRAWQFVKG